GSLRFLVPRVLISEIPEIIGVGAALGLVNLGVIVSENVRLARILNDTYDIVAAALGLRPVNGGGTAPPAEGAGRQAGEQYAAGRPRRARAPAGLPAGGS